VVRAHSAVPDKQLIYKDILARLASKGGTDTSERPGLMMGRRRKLVIGILLSIASVLVVLSAFDRMLGENY
jgi:hypothetical protein